VPLLNTTVLLASGIFVTIRHHAIIVQKNRNIDVSIKLTIILGLYFTALQA
jgi:heme/copper-type cytochrome/quinol oxidase subunit 3